MGGLWIIEMFGLVDIGFVSVGDFLHWPDYFLCECFDFLFAPGNFEVCVRV